MTIKHEQAIQSGEGYDVFISYRTIHRQWVETLATNLERNGYRVFLDAWRLIPGQSFVKGIHDALKASRCGVLVATPDATESGWVQKEYELMLAQSAKGGFHFIPVVFGEFPDLPFLETVQAVDFKQNTAEQYRQGFHRLLCGIEQREPGTATGEQYALTLPAPAQSDQRGLDDTEASFVDEAFMRLNSGNPLIVLAQEDASIQAVVNALKSQALARYGEDHFIHVFPPATSDADGAAYFRRLAKQCGFDTDITSNWEWCDAFEDRLHDGPVFLLITGFENGADALRGGLARELLGLLERYQNLRVVIAGSQGLASLRYANGPMSLLNIAESIYAPELNIAQIRQFYATKDKIPADQTLQDILGFTGGHPRCTYYCLHKGVSNIADCEQVLRQSEIPSQLFTRFRDSDHRPQVVELLRKNRVGRYDPWPENIVLRKLFWANLVVQEGEDLIWRSEFIRQIGLAHLDRRPC